MNPVGIDSNEPLADYTMRLISATGLSADERAVAEVVQSEMRELGFDVHVDEYGNVTGTIDAGPGPCVLLDSHIDTVDVVDRDEWQHDSAGERVGNRIYGRGSVDMKGPLAAATYGVAELASQLTSGRVVVAGTVAEELVEGVALAKVVERVKPDYVVICEPSDLGLSRGHRGRAELVVEVVGRAAHTSRPELGINAGEVFADVVVALRQIPMPTHPLLGDAILVLSDVVSSPYPGLSSVPHSCVANYDRRMLPSETMDDVLRPVQTAVDEIASRYGARVDVRIGEDDFTTYTGTHVRVANFAPAWICDDDAPIMKRAQDGLRDVGLPVVLTHYVFSTNGSTTAGELGIPTIGFGPGRGELAHRRDEYVEVADIAKATRGYAGIVKSLLRS